MSLYNPYLRCAAPPMYMLTCNVLTRNAPTRNVMTHDVLNHNVMSSNLGPHMS